MKKIPVGLLLLSLACVARGAEPDSKPANPPTNPITETTKGKKTAKPAKKASTKTQAEIIAAAFPEFDHLPDIVYKKVGDQALQMEILTPKGLKNPAAPVLVYIHGGGWSGGDRFRMTRPDISGVFHHCAKAGIICASVEYRLNSPKASAFDSAIDCKDALRFLVKNAAQYHIDPTRIATIGGSAGGHLSLVTALGDPKKYPGDPELAAFDPASIRCEIAYYPATDFTDEKLAGRFLGQRATLMFGGPADQKRDIMRLLSPVVLIQKNSTPIFCFHGDKDTVLSVENSRKLFAQGKEVGAEIQYVEVKEGTHGFGLSCSPSIEEITAMASKFVIEHLQR